MKKLLWPCLVLTLLCCGSPADQDLPEAYRRIEVAGARLESAEARARGAVLFATHCALCHGNSGDGRGVRARNLSSPARDLTAPSWHNTTSPRRIFFAIREGVPGTAMPPWKALSEEECWDLTAFVLSLGPKDAS